MLGVWSCVCRSACRATAAGDVPSARATVAVAAGRCASPVNQALMIVPIHASQCTRTTHTRIQPQPRPPCAAVVFLQLNSHGIAI